MILHGISAYIERQGLALSNTKASEGSAMLGNDRVCEANARDCKT